MSRHSALAAALTALLLAATTNIVAQTPATGDAALAAKVRAALTQQYGASVAARVRIDVRGGAVSLAASELNSAQRTQALSLVRGIPGVTDAMDVSVGAGIVGEKGSGQIVGEKGRGTGKVIGEKGRGSGEIIGEEGTQAVIGEEGRSTGEIIGEDGRAPEASNRQKIRVSNAIRTPGVTVPVMVGGKQGQPGMGAASTGGVPLPGVSPESNENGSIPGKNTNGRVVDGASGGIIVQGGMPLPGVSPQGNDNGGNGREGNNNGGGPPVGGPENARASMAVDAQAGGIVRPPNQYGNKNENPPGKNDNTRRLGGVYGKSPDNDNKAGGGSGPVKNDAALVRDATEMLNARFGAAAANLRVSAAAGVVKIEAMNGNALGRAEIDSALQGLPAGREIDVP